MELKVSRKSKPEKTIVKVSNIEIGSSKPVIIAGPCAVEGEEEYLKEALFLKEAGVQILRGGAFKPRTSPYTFAGLGEEGLKILAKAREITGMPVVTEVLDPRDVEIVAQYADILQIGSRNMQNFTLLKEVGLINKPVLLKRGLAATLKEWLLAAEYIVSAGNEQVILCERGIRTFEDYTRNTFDLAGMVAALDLTHLPVIADPSHATGRRELVSRVALGAIAAGADGIMVEVHPEPVKALSDGQQSLDYKEFQNLITMVKRFISQSA
ncbi:3-deoxy-7-phosphoheptulonate synthase [Carboxydothermus islandicus]|uniref:3-deoxy-7-phosphoheptulonate synthase n=1 Tax=Carboxydothermus islandicus TaxID=661089 RepID=A0A1L8D0A9_9THEO|nr:3-deoxy-7-phosphoheptulonate synthase [Carboxydothermus islandicus]GAV24625.1 3-deoxy-7-phosphoheptulonate synthase [Carboxydothermus islandicus]